MAALMTSDYDNIDRLAIEISECNNMGIKVLSPDVKESFLEFAVVPGKSEIRFGMAAIKNVGTAAVEEILRAREEQKFHSLEDFFSRVNARIVNRKAVDSLIKAGAMDAWGTRTNLLHNVDTLLAFASRVQKEKASGQIDLFGSLIEEVAEATPMLSLIETQADINVREQLQWERELLGLYISSHPLEDYKLWLAEQTIPIRDITPDLHNKAATIGGVVVDLREILTKKGQKMAFAKIADEYGEIELILFPGIYEKSNDLWKRDTVVVLTGKISGQDRDGNTSASAQILVDSAREVTHAEVQNYVPNMKKIKTPKVTKPKKKKEVTVSKKEAPIPHKRLYIKLPSNYDQKILLSLKEAIDAIPGRIEVVLVIGEKSQRQIIKLPMTTSDDDAALIALKTIVGEQNVKLQ
jgi:DNA polymerase-3 subunit alpha